LTSITIPDSVTSIGYNAFNGTALATVYISSTTANILGVTSPNSSVNFFGTTVDTRLP